MPVLLLGRGALRGAYRGALPRREPPPPPQRRHLPARLPGCHRDRRRGGGPLRLPGLRSGLPGRQAAGGGERDAPERRRALPLAQRLAERRGWRGPLTRGWADGAGRRVGRGGVGADRGMTRGREEAKEGRKRGSSGVLRSDAIRCTKSLAPSLVHQWAFAMLGDVAGHREDRFVGCLLTSPAPLG